MLSKGSIEGPASNPSWFVLNPHNARRERERKKTSELTKLIPIRTEKRRRERERERERERDEKQSRLFFSFPYKKENWDWNKEMPEYFFLSLFSWKSKVKVIEVGKRELERRV